MEITESDVIRNKDFAYDLLNALRSQQIKISIDDFGTGYSSLSYLHQFPFSHMKIDKSFTHQIQDQCEKYKIIKAIVLLAKNLGMKVVAEGIETQAQLQYLKNLDCDFGQGYIFARPIFEADMPMFLTQFPTLN